MGRKLNTDEWVEVESRIAAGESLRTVAAAFGVSYGMIYAKLKKSEPEKVTAVATKIVAARIAKEELSPIMQIKAENMADSLMFVNSLMLRSAKLAAGTAFKMSGLANLAAESIQSGEIDVEQVKMVNALTEVANKAAIQPMELLKANRELMSKQDSGEEPYRAKLSDFYAPDA